MYYDDFNVLENLITTLLLAVYRVRQ